jgi:hypothetical protein
MFKFEEIKLLCFITRKFNRNRKINKTPFRKPMLQKVTHIGQKGSLNLIALERRRIISTRMKKWLWNTWNNMCAMDNPIYLALLKLSSFHGAPFRDAYLWCWVIIQSNWTYTTAFSLWCQEMNTTEAKWQYKLIYFRDILPKLCWLGHY